MDFRITGLPAEEFAELQRATGAELARLGIERHFADEANAFPCRISLQDAAIGEEMLLLNFRHQPAANPYAGTGPIFIGRTASRRFDAINLVPDQQRRRLLSVRAFDSRDTMVDADVVPGTGLETLIARFFGDPQVAYLHVHNARRGCYACRVDRV